MKFFGKMNDLKCLLKLPAEFVIKGFEHYHQFFVCCIQDSGALKMSGRKAILELKQDYKNL